MLELGKGVLVFSMVHAYVFSILLFSYKKLSTTFLALYLITCSVNYFLFLNTIYFQLEDLNFLFYYLTPTLSLVSMPFVYFYVKHMTTESYKLTFKKILVHFSVPSLFLISTAVLIQLMDKSDQILVFGGSPKVESAFALFLNYLIASVLVILQLFIYSFFMLRAMYKHDSNVEQFYSNKSNKTLVWLKVFVLFYVLYYLFEFSVFIFSGISISDNVYYSIVSLHIFFVGYMGIKQREIYKSENTHQDEIETSSAIEKETTTDEVKKMSVITPELRDNILQAIERLMKVEKLYLQEDLSLYDLAKSLNINKNYLSHIINDSLDTNFYNLINSYRIEDAKSMLLNPEFDNLSVEGISQSVGFKSRSVFYPVFKKYTGTTPTEYKKENSK